ncbi:hypothetical protein ACTFIZ_005730 [Dictyostelium cf. discoideum]
MDNINVYDNKCAIHKDQDIKLICSACKVVVCLECIVTIHNGHKFYRTDEENSKEIFEEFKNNNFQNLHKQIDINNELLNESNNLFKSLEDKHNKNVNTITEVFKQLHKLLQIIENDKTKQLVTLYDENKNINTIISTTIHDNLNKINLIKNKYKNTINQINIDQIINNNSNQHIEILKHCYQSQQLIKDNQNENKIKELMNQYKNVNIVNNSEQIKDSIKEIFEISNSPSITNVPKRVIDNNSNQHIEILKHCYQSQQLIKDNQNENKIKELMNQYKNVNIVKNSEQVKEIYVISDSPSITNVKDPKKVTAGGYEYFIYKDDSIIPNGTTRVVIPPSVKTIKIGSIPTSVRYLILLDGFNVQLTEGMLPQSIRYLLVGAIKKPLLKGSVPNGVQHLFLLDGFNQEISEIPRPIYFYLFDTPLTNFPYAQNIFRSTKYKHQLTRSNVNAKIINTSQDIENNNSNINNSNNSNNNTISSNSNINNNKNNSGNQQDQLVDS